MAQSNSSWIRCFLCRRKNSRAKGHKSIDDSHCPVSKKSVKDVLQHLARSAKTELHIPLGEWVCLQCHDQLAEYDATLVRLLRKQRKLFHLVEQAAIGFDSDYEKECTAHMATMEEFNDDRCFDDVTISEDEITQTMHEAMGVTKKKKRRENRFTPSPTPSIDNHRNKQKTMHPCNFCAMRFKNKISLHKHISLAHKKFGCELCSYTHRNEEYVKLHMNLHEGRSENQCRFCDKEFTTKISTIRHMEVHLDSKKYQCDKCGLCFSQTTVLYNHKLQHEAEEQPLRCEICNQVFKTKRTYRHHMITHRADRPRYSCEFCAKTFTEKYTLKVHRRTHPEAAAETANRQQQQQQQQQMMTVVADGTNVQTGLESKFNCIICDQTFTSKDQLNKHMEKEHDVILKSLTLTNYSQYEVVTNESKKPCHICGQLFSAQSNLDQHLEHVHGLSFK